MNVALISMRIQIGFHWQDTICNLHALLSERQKDKLDYRYRALSPSLTSQVVICNGFWHWNRLALVLLRPIDHAHHLLLEMRQIRQFPVSKRIVPVLASNVAWRISVLLLGSLRGRQTANKLVDTHLIRKIGLAMNARKKEAVREPYKVAMGRATVPNDHLTTPQHDLLLVLLHRILTCESRSQRIS